MLDVANSEVFISLDGEDYPCNSIVPNNVLQTDIEKYRARIVCSDDAPQGKRYFEFQTVENQTNAYTKIIGHKMPILNIENKTFYLAFYFNFTRINNKDIWDIDAEQSGDKGVEIVGNGIRWALSRGYWGTFNNVDNGKYIIWPGNPTYHIDKVIELHDSILPNKNGFNRWNPVQVPYDTWNSIVFELKVSSTKSGSIRMYANSVLTFEYINTQTAAFKSSSIDKLRLGGTIRQPTYNAPSHKRKFDNFIFSDNLDDILDAGYIITK